MLSRVKSVSLKQIQEKTSSRTTDLQHHTSSNIWFIQHFGNFANFPPWKCHGYFQEVWLEPGVRLVCRSAAPCSLQWALYVKKRCNFTCILRIYREEQWYLLGFKHWTLYQALAQKLGGNYDSHSGAFFLHSAFYRLHLLVYFSGKIRPFCTKRGRFFLCWIPIILWRYRQLRVSGLQHEPRVIFSFPGLGCWLCHPLLVSWGHRFNNFNSLMTSHDLLFLFVVLLRYPDGAFESRYPLHIEECWELKLFLGWNRNESFIGHHLGDLRYPAKGIAALVTCFPTFLRCFAWKELGHRKLGSLKAGDPCVHDGYGLWCVHWGQGCLGRLRQHLLEDAVFLLVTQQYISLMLESCYKVLQQGKAPLVSHDLFFHGIQSEDADCNRVICDNIATSTPMEVRSGMCFMLSKQPDVKTSWSRSTPTKATGRLSKICVVISRTSFWSVGLCFLMLMWEVIEKGHHHRQDAPQIKLESRNLFFWP